MFQCDNCKTTFKKEVYYKAHLATYKTQEKFLQGFMGTSFEGIERVNEIPKVVYVFWFGGCSQPPPHMTNRRFAAFQSLVTNMDVPVILVTKDNHKMFIKEDYPMHKAFEYLSGTHKSDYLRAYFLHHYGGGYHDIKFREKSWENAWDDNNWTSDTTIWMYGRREKETGCIGYPPGGENIQKEYNKLATMCWIICKPNTPYTTELMRTITLTLDIHLEALIKHPAYNASDYYRKHDSDPPDSYPLRWLEIMGEIFHPLMLKYTQHIKFGLPDATKRRYK